MGKNRVQSRSFLIACGIIVAILVQAACVIRFNQPTFNIPSSQIDSPPSNMETAIAHTVVAVEGPQSGENYGAGPVNQETAIYQTVAAVEGPQSNGGEDATGNPVSTSISPGGSTSSDSGSGSGISNPPSDPSSATTQAPPSNPTVATTRAPENNSANPNTPLQPPSNNNQPNQNANVTVFNHSSRPIVSLVIDGAEQILAESDSILSGGSAGLIVSDGKHTIVAHNGYWEDGYRKTLNNWSISFSKQDSPIDIYDHSISLLLPKYQQTGYLGGEYWEGDIAVRHYTCFAFTNSGAFTYYVDGAFDDSGTYAEVSRNPAGFTITFQVTTSAGESLQGTYNELGDSFMMRNGSADWPIIDYSRISGCP